MVTFYDAIFDVYCTYIIFFQKVPCDHFGSSGQSLSKDEFFIQTRTALIKISKETAKIIAIY